MGEIRRQPKNGPYRRIAQVVRVRAAVCLASLYLLLSVFATLHCHSVGVLDLGASTLGASHCASSIAAIHDGKHTTTSWDRIASALPTIEASNCPVCDFLAQPVTSVSAQPIVLVPIAQTAIPAPPVRSVAYKPFRFCDRSASRAPPAISSHLA